MARSLLELQLTIGRPTAATDPHGFVLWVAALLAPVPPRPLRPGGLRPAVLKAPEREEALERVTAALAKRAANGPPAPAPERSEAGGKRWWWGAEGWGKGLDI